MVDEQILTIYQDQRKNMVNNPLRDPKYRVQKLKDLYQNILKLQPDIC